MKKFIFLMMMIAVCSVGLRAQVTVSLPAPYGGMLTLAGSVRLINATIGGGTTNEVNWSYSATGGETASLSCTSACQPWVYITIGSVQGNCSITGSIGSYSVTSTAAITLTAQSVDNTSVSTSMTIPVCQNTDQVVVVPFYDVLYANQKMDLQSWVVGASMARQGVTWSITSQPSGGNGTLSDTTFRDTVFSASVAGRYTVQACSTDNGSACQSSTLYVTGNALPSYASTPSDTEPVDCTPDPNETGTVYQVKPSGTSYSTINSALTAICAPSGTTCSTLAWGGNTIQVYNVDTTGSNPTVYHEWLNNQGNGTATQPLRIVGCPDSLGNLPIVDGNGATGSSWGSTADEGLSVITSGPKPNATGLYQSTPVTTAYFLVEGLHVRNGNPSYNYYPPGSGTATAWGDASCIRVFAGQDYVIRGNELESCSDGTLEDFNASRQWLAFNGYALWEGNHIHGNGLSGSGSYHQVYWQGWLGVWQGNRIDLMLNGAEGGNLKDRGIGTVVRYNYLGDGAGTPNSPLRQLDAVGNQDSPDYMVPSQSGATSGAAYIGFSGNTTCSTSLYCSGDTMGINMLTGWWEQWHQYNFYGNVIQSSAANWAAHFMDDNGFNVSARQGLFAVYSNTFNLTAASYGLFDTDDNSGGTQIEQPYTVAQNNIAWMATSGSYADYGCWNRISDFVSGSAAFTGFVTNNVSSVLDSITLPISNSAACNTASGWSASAGSITTFTNATPINNHISGITSANFILAGSQPFTSGTYVPTFSGGATALTGAMAMMPVRFQYAPVSSSVSVRNYPLTIGAVDPGSVTSITVTPSSASIVEGATQQFAAQCFYSNGSNSVCTSSVSWTSSGTSIATINSSGLATASATTSGTVTITATDPSTSIQGTASLTVTSIPTAVYKGLNAEGVVLQ